MDGGSNRRQDRDSDLGDDSPMSHTDEQSDREDEIRDCESSDEGVNVNPSNTLTSGGIGFGRSPEHISDMSHPSHFAQNHPLSLLNNLTALGMGQSLQSLQHGDVLEKLKMQVRDMNVGLMDPENFATLHHQYGGNIASYAAAAAGGQNLSKNGFPFASPNPSNTKDANPASNSSTSSEGSNSSQQNNGWSFEEQFKQVRQLYEINDDPKRKEFLDDLFLFMQKRGTPINRLPIMAKSVLDLYELYNLVIARGGLVDVINKKLWQEIIKGLHLPSSITSAAFTLRTQYMKYLYPYECEKKNLSTPSELQAAIDGNRREGRRSSYNQFDASMQSQLQMPMRRSPIPSLQQSPLPLVSHQHAAQMNNRLMVPQLPPHELEKRVFEMYSSLLNNPKESLKRAQSPDSMHQTLNAHMEMQRLAQMWNLYNNNHQPAALNSPPNSLNTSPMEHQKALDLSESPPHHHLSIKRERERDHHHAPEYERERDLSYPPEKKRPPSTPVRLQQSALDSSMEERSTPTPGPQENGTDYSTKSAKSKSNGGESPSAATPILNGMQFKIISRGNSATGEQQLVVTMEVNGVQYEGVLFANPHGAGAVPLTSVKQALNTTATSTTSSLDERSSRPLVS